MSLDVSLHAVRRTQVYDANITHNLAGMAKEAGVYLAMWQPDEIGISTAAELAEILETGLAKLEAEPERFRAMNPPNGWGSYEGLVQFVRNYLQACRDNPDAEVEASR